MRMHTNTPRIHYIHTRTYQVSALAPSYPEYSPFNVRLTPAQAKILARCQCVELIMGETKKAKLDLSTFWCSCNSLHIQPGLPLAGFTI